METKEIEIIIEKAVQKAIKAERAEAEEKESRKAYNLTFRYLKQYSDMVSSLKSDATAAGEAENDFLILLERAKTPTAVIIANLQRCLKELQEEQTKKGQKYKYEVLEMYFFQNLTYEQIIEKMPMGDSTPRRWVSEMVGILAVKLFGVTAIHK